MVDNIDKIFPIEKDSNWINRTRTLIVSSRGSTERHRHLMLDFVSLMPHAKKEVKLEKKNYSSQISELLSLHNCYSFVFFETRKNQDLYIWIGSKKITFKFLVENIYTAKELKLTGNCLKGSRPILSFDKSFTEKPENQLLKELFSQVFNIPKNHPKCKPCVDHCFSFIETNGRIWFRNYQLFHEQYGKGLTDQELFEIGPRFVLNPIVLFDGCMEGRVLFKNDEYISKTQVNFIYKDICEQEGREEQRSDEEAENESQEGGKIVNIIKT